jgi:hypothetical protein
VRQRDAFFVARVHGREYRDARARGARWRFLMPRGGSTSYISRRAN